MSHMSLGQKAAENGCVHSQGGQSWNQGVSPTKISSESSREKSAS